MTEPKFMTPAHRRAYLTHLNRCKAMDSYHRALIYILTAVPALRNNMRRVESAFADYLENEDSIDLLWSDKVGYVFLTINEKTHQSESCEDLHTAPQLCHRLLDDMAITVLLQTKRNHNFTNMDKDEAARVRAAWKPVIEKLPDYAYLCDEILREAQENEEENGIDLQ